MKLAVAVVVVVCIALPARSQDAGCPEVAALNALYEVRAALIHRSTSYEVGSVIDDRIDALRGPLKGGGYRWVHYTRPASNAPIERREHNVGAVYDGQTWDRVEGSANHTFAVKVVVPKKRSLFKANNEVFVRMLTVTYAIDGESMTLKKTIGEWMAPDTSRTFELRGIADSAEATVEVAARPGKNRETVAEIHFKQAVAEDDPDNPGYETIQTLRRLRGTSDPEAVDYEIGRLERRLFPALEPVPFTTLLVRIRDAEKLIRSEKDQDQTKGKKLLSDTIKAYPR